MKGLSLKLQAVTIVGIGALLGFGIFLLGNYLGWNLPAEVAVAFGTIVGWLLGKIF